MRKLSFIFLLIALLLSGASPLAAKTDGDSSTCIENMRRRFVVLDSLIFSAMPADSAARIVVDTSLTAKNAEYEQAVAEATRGKINAFRAQNGLELAAQTYWRKGGNLMSAPLDEDDIEAGYWGKFQVELRWNIFGSSLFNRTGKEGQYRIEGEIQSLEGRAELIAIAIREQREILLAEHEKRLATILDNLSQNYGLMLETYGYLLKNESILSNKVLDMADRKDDVDRKMASMGRSRSYQGDLTLPRADKVIVDTTALLEGIRNSSLAVKTLQKRNELLGCKGDNITYLGSSRITPFVRYSQYYRQVAGPSSILDVGVTMSIPLNGATQKQKTAYKAEQRLVDLQTASLLSQLKTKALIKVADIEKANNSIEILSLQIARTREYIKKRTAAYAAIGNSYNHFERMEEYNAYLKNLERLENLIYNRDCLIVDLQALCGEVSVLDFCTINPID